jgi:CHAT domain-containing protein/tetratricopeptide (TPR) repeat protein
LKVLDNPPSVDEWAHAVTSYGHHVLRPLFAYDEERLERVIGLLEQTRVVHPRDKAPEKWANHTADLAVAYSLRRKGDHVVNGERAIVLLLQALEVQTRDANPEKWAQHLSNLAVQYFERQVSDRQDNLRRAIEAGQQALEMQSAEREPIPRANTLANLGAVYAEYEEGDRAENIERAIGYFEEVERLFSETGLSGRPHAILLFELGKTKFERLRGDRADNIEQAIGYLERAAVAASAEAASDVRVGARDLVAEAYTERLRGQPSDNRTRAEMHRREALKICSPQFLPVECRKVASRLGGMYSDDQRWSEAVATYRLAIDASEAAYEKSILGRTRDIERSQAMTLYADAAYAMARAGMLREAVVTLERARGRELADALALAADLEGIRAKDRQRYERLQEVLRRLNGLEAMDRRLRVTNSGAIAAPDDDGLRAELQAALNRIRELPGYETFLLSPEWPAVRALLAGLDRSPLVFVLAARCGGLALVVRTSTGAGNGGDPAIDAVWSTLRTSDLLRLLVGNRQPEDGGWLGGYSRRRVDPLGWLSTVENVSRVTWDLLMAPLAEDLRRTHDSEVVLVPCGMLALLPLHAAWTEMPDSAARHYFLDEFACRYAPSIRAQAETHKVAQRSPANKLLAVDEPRPVTTAGPLPNSATEVRAVASHFKEVVLLAHEEATRSRVLEALATADVAHFACHGKNDVGEPLRSGILLSNDEHLTVGDILDMHLHSARLVTLSACETGVIGVNAPDEVVGLPAALVQAGCAGVVSSLWSVSDVSTAMLMERFYRLWRMDGMSPALALREAQRWLRDSTNQEKADGYREDGPTPAGSPPAMSSSAQAFVTDGRSRAPAARTFEHPFWWAAFYLTGE